MLRPWEWGSSQLRLRAKEQAPLSQRPGNPQRRTGPLDQGRVGPSPGKEAGRAGSLPPEDKLLACAFFLKESQTFAALSWASFKWATYIRVDRFYLRVFQVCALEQTIESVFSSTYPSRVKQRSQLRSDLLLKQCKICHAWKNRTLIPGSRVL